MNEQDNPTVRFIYQMARRIFERNIRGQYNYEADLKSYKRFLGIAQQNNADTLEANLINYMAVLNGICGYLQLAEEQLDEFFTRQQTLGNKSGMATALNNKAFFIVSLGKYEQAKDLYEQALTLCEEDIEKTFMIYGLVLSGRLGLCFMLQEYDAMPAYYAKFETIKDQLLERNRQYYARIMTEIYRSMGEYHLHLKDYKQAQNTISLGMEMATGLDLAFELADLYHTQAHIALTQEDEAKAEEAWEKAIAILDNVPSKSTVGRNYRQESSYLERAGYHDHAKRFAKYAYDIFESLQLEEDIALTKNLL